MVSASKDVRTLSISVVAFPSSLTAMALSPKQNPTNSTTSLLYVLLVFHRWVPLATRSVHCFQKIHVLDTTSGHPSLLGLSWVYLSSTPLPLAQRSHFGLPLLTQWDQLRSHRPWSLMSGQPRGIRPHMPNDIPTLTSK